MDSGRTGGTGRPSVRDAAWVVLYLRLDARFAPVMKGFFQKLMAAPRNDGIALWRFLCGYCDSNARISALRLRTIQVSRLCTKSRSCSAVLMTDPRCFCPRLTVIKIITLSLSVNFNATPPASAVELFLFKPGPLTDPKALSANRAAGRGKGVAVGGGG